MYNRKTLQRTRRRNMKKATNTTKVNMANKPRKKKKRKRNPPVSKRKFRHALKGTAGILKEIAAKLDTNPRQVRRYLIRPGWEDIRREWEDEKDRVLELAEDTISEMILQREDPKIAADTAKWFLERKGKHKGFGDKIQIEGGDTPIRHEVGVVVLDESHIAGMSLEDRKALLHKIESGDGDVKQIEEARVIEKD